MIKEDLEKELIEHAKSNLKRAYAPYSNYKVGAALLGESERIYDGANIEMSIHRATHAERMALDQGVMAGDRKFTAIAVVTDDNEAPYPCGQCLQDLTEFDIGRNGDLEIIAANLDGTVKRLYLRDLLPHRFGPANLGLNVREY